jgi:hypothetical protein
MNCGQKFLRESEIDPTEDTLILFVPDSEFWIKTFHTFVICDQFGRAWFRSINYA